MVFKFFTIRLGVRLLVACSVMAAWVWLLVLPGFHYASLLAAIALAFSLIELWRFVSRTNRELTRFLDSARNADFSQRFDFDDAGMGFKELGQAFAEILERMRTARNQQQIQLRNLQALVDHIPVPLLSLHADDSISLQNNAARRLFGSAHVTKLNDLLQFGVAFRDSVSDAVPGQRELVRFRVDDIDYSLTLATTEVLIAGRKERLVSLQDIQTELDVNEAEAWQDLVRVLTHEIMNSITPVTSLAKTSVDLVADLSAKASTQPGLKEDLEDLDNAVTTVARRSDSLLRFVESYRQITRLAPPEKKRIPIAALFDSVSKLAIAEWPEAESALRTSVVPKQLDVFADRDLIEPVLLNLIRNARHATEDRPSPSIHLTARQNRRGNVVIEVSDNGPGVPENIATKIFVPFFTTKHGGSGVGLALARQVMTAHGGFIRLLDADEPGAKFTLSF